MFSVCRICQASYTFVTSKVVLPNKSHLPTAVAAKRFYRYFAVRNGLTSNHGYKISAIESSENIAIEVIENFG